MRPGPSLLFLETGGSAGGSSSATRLALSCFRAARGSSAWAPSSSLSLERRMRAWLGGGPVTGAAVPNPYEFMSGARELGKCILTAKSAEPARPFCSCEGGNTHGSFWLDGSYVWVRVDNQRRQTCSLSDCSCAAAEQGGATGHQNHKYTDDRMHRYECWVERGRKTLDCVGD